MPDGTYYFGTQRTDVNYRSFLFVFKEMKIVAIFLTQYFSFSICKFRNNIEYFLIPLYSSFFDL